MDKLSVYDAKARFSELIERAQSGRTTVVTKRGKVVAKIVPAKERAWDRSAVLDEIEAVRKSLAVKRRFKIADLLAEGRM
ncbi:MAG TPA: type II toxin-antitoxin system prevent-host-death family antitoxin [Casimicrobiaceae bacterium]|nr:type II toxin-antitoxin system prevent-host-death family antitoxin [Casimicrobiaceae bacterium]